MGDVIATTERLLLRVPELADAAVHFEMGQDPEVIRYTGDPPFASLDGARALIEELRERQRREGATRWTVVERSSGDALGWCGIKLWTDGTWDLGYRFLRRSWGSGYATESARASIDHAFGELGLECLVGRAAIENVASLRVLEKLGFQRTGEADCEGLPAIIHELWRPGAGRAGQ